MRSLQKYIVLLLALSFPLSGTLAAQVQFTAKYPDIPIVDVHVHFGNVAGITNYLNVSEVLKERHGSNLAFFIGVNDPGGNLAEMKAAADNRVLFATCQMRPHRGLTITAEEVISKVRNDGYVGLKFWFGPAYRALRDDEEGIRRIDDPRLADFFAALEQERILLHCLHIADPNGPFYDRKDWLQDPVFYWTQIRAFENVVAKYPNLPIIAAHSAWLVCQDAQIDYLRYMLHTYPNLYIETSATYQYMYLVNRDNMRDFFIEYQDRILLGSDWMVEGPVDQIVNLYAGVFAYLETDQMITGGYFRATQAQGLDLPREVLEKIYYRNAVKLIPGLKEAMGL